MLSKPASQPAICERSRRGCAHHRRSEVARPRRAATLAAASLAIAVASVVPATVVAASGGGREDPRLLVLARSDLPAGAKLIPKRAGAAAAIAGLLVAASERAALARASRHYQAAYHLPGRDVFSAAFVFGSDTTARIVFAKQARSLPDVYRRVQVPKLGDAQITTYTVADAYEHRFIVRRGAVIWQLDILDWRASPRPNLTAAATALARKQQGRVG